MKTFDIRILKLLILSLVLAACVSTPAPLPETAPTAIPPTTASSNTNIIKLATLEWSPYVGESLPQYGFTTAIVSEAFKRAGYEVKVDFMPWTRVIKESGEGTYDAAFPEYYSEERAQEFLMSEPFTSGPLGFYKRKADKITYTKLEDLKPYRIGVVIGYINTPEFDAANYLKKDEANSDEQNIRKLLAGRIDLAVIDKYVAQQLIKTSIPEAAGALEFMEPPLQDQPLYVIFPRKTAGSEEKLKAFNAALKTMRDDGTLADILNEYGFGNQ
jgi:polar amino acid transport system substrate-binding protein